MKFTYNGVTLELVEITQYVREAVYSHDGADLLYVKHRLAVVCTVAPGGWPQGLSIEPSSSQSRTYPDIVSNRTPITAKGTVLAPFVKGKPGAAYAFPKRQPNPGAAAVGTDDPPAFYTDHELRMRLMIPRRDLKITAYRADGREYTWLQSPRPFVAPVKAVGPDAGIIGYRGATDAANGPIPLRCDVLGPSGEAGSFGVHFMIETCLPPVAPEEERLILSHRWDVTHMQDEDHYLTRVTTGVVVFNGSLLGLAGQSPDWYREQFFHPIPLGFERKVPVVTATSDGLSVRYTVVDTDPRVMFDPGDSGATGMEIVETLNYLTPSALN